MTFHRRPPAALQSPNAGALRGTTGRVRKSAPSCRGGVSSLLRLGHALSSSFPTASSLSQWVQRAAGLLLPNASPATTRVLARDMTPDLTRAATPTPRTPTRQEFAASEFSAR